MSLYFGRYKTSISERRKWVNLYIKKFVWNRYSNPLMYENYQDIYHCWYIILKA